jgi:protein involved in polysaccharide export with SLBB domain
MKWLACGLVVILIAGTGCARLRSIRDAVPAPASVEGVTTEQILQEAAQYTNQPVLDAGEPAIRAGHVISVIVMAGGVKEVEEPDRRVSTLGSISLPLVGAVDVAGLTLREVAIVLRQKYGQYIRDPVVDVAFMVDRSPGAVSPWGYVTVLGRVKQPGRINIPPTQDLTLSMAVQLAGGYDASANDTAIRVTRALPDGGMETVDVDLRSAASRGRVHNDLQLKAGDVVYIPEKVF